MTRVSPGIRFELTVRDWYEAKGYTVIRAAGSRGPADLIAINEDAVVLVQCKVEQKARGYSSATKELLDVDVPHGTRKELWVKRGQTIRCHEIGVGEGVDFVEWTSREFNKEMKEASDD